MVDYVFVEGQGCQPEINKMYLPLVIRSEEPPVCNNQTMDVTVGGQINNFPFEVNGQTYDFGLLPLSTVLQMHTTQSVSWSVSSGWYKYLPDGISRNFTGVWP